MAFEKQFGVIFTNPKLPVLDYSTLDESIDIGSLVEVPLGSKVVIGVVWRAGDTNFDHSRLKQIIGTVRNIKLSPEFIFFLKRSHAYTLSPIQYFLKMTVQSLNFHKDQKVPIAYKLNNSFCFQITPRQKEHINYIKEQPQRTVQYKKIKKDLGVSFSVIKSLEQKEVLSRVAENKYKEERILIIDKFYNFYILNPVKTRWNARLLLGD